MNLKAFLSETKISRVILAQKLGTSPAYLSHIINGHRRPSIKLTAKIIEATQGQVTGLDLRPDLAELDHKNYLNDSAGL